MEHNHSTMTNFYGVTSADLTRAYPSTDARALHFPADDDGNPDSWQVQAGEYADEPDLVILIEHAVDSEGRDVRENTARRIAALLARPTYVSDSPLMDRVAAETVADNPTTED